MDEYKAPEQIAQSDIDTTNIKPTIKRKSIQGSVIGRPFKTNYSGIFQATAHKNELKLTDTEFIYTINDKQTTINIFYDQPFLDLKNELTRRRLSVDLISSIYKYWQTYKSKVLAKNRREDKKHEKLYKLSINK